eukprot:scaffold37999_cov214-Skeletonema_marinoi.AAC.10
MLICFCSERPSTEDLATRLILDFGQVINPVREKVNRWKGLMKFRVDREIEMAPSSICPFQVPSFVPFGTSRSQLRLKYP